MQPQPAFLLHKRPYRETSALVELLTLGHGRVRAVAQGVQRPGSRSRAQLQPFAPLHVTWVGEGELKRLRLMESRGAAALLVGEGLLCGLYANELLTRTLPVELPVADVFAFYTALLEALPRPKGAPRPCGGWNSPCLMPSMPHRVSPPRKARRSIPRAVIASTPPRAPSCPVNRAWMGVLCACWREATGRRQAWRGQPRPSLAPRWRPCLACARCGPVS